MNKVLTLYLFNLLARNVGGRGGLASEVGQAVRCSPQVRKEKVSLNSEMFLL